MKIFIIPSSILLKVEGSLVSENIYIYKPNSADKLLVFKTFAEWEKRDEIKNSLILHPRFTHQELSTSLEGPII
ncbi:hypothetical protein Glove_172g50 [Diversispora epigaea]|uniref:Uncharacterized protein n=1 Tax=Diversispora epigaea TaxID=1348612 RepID=A0A397IP60_9GLOM|nr:hypothetical protein Glove_172g50 [Diversispora epigaea]